VLVLRSRRPLAAELAEPSAADADACPDELDGAASPEDTAEVKAARPPRSIRLLTRTTLRHESLALRTALLTRSVHTAADLARIEVAEAGGKALMIFPPRSTPPVSRLTTDPKLLAGALEAGRQAARDTFRAP
jgi:hypothetical protein